MSEPISPTGGRFDVAAMGRGEPGVPGAFTWRGRCLRVEACLRRWKATASEGGRPDGDVYLRRHYYLLSMSDGTVWTVYFLRQPSRSGSPKARWYLYGID